MQEAVLGLSDCYLFGLGVKRDLQFAIGLLTDAAHEGNIEAGLELVAIYRDGRKDHGRRLIGKNSSLARTYFVDDIKDFLSVSRIAYEDALLQAADKPGLETYERFLRSWRHSHQICDGQCCAKCAR